MQLLVVGEDALCCALGERLARDCLPHWSLAAPSINTRGVTRLRTQLPRYGRLAAHAYPVLCIADTDGQCALHLRRAWIATAPSGLVLRLAVPEAESWVMADAGAFAHSFAVPMAKVPRKPDEVADPKAELLALARRSKRRPVRDEVVSALDPTKAGSGYNLHLCAFVNTGWRAAVAAESSPSLRRALTALSALAAGA